MTQFLVIALIVAVIYFVYFKDKPSKIKPHKKSDTTKEDADEMIPCAKCGTYAPLEDCLLSGGKQYCSKECLPKER